MALVLRNASIQKQVSLLKCMKTRTVVTTANKNNNQAPISAAVRVKNGWRSLTKTALNLPSSLMPWEKPLQHAMAFSVLKSSSCPNLEKTQSNPHMITVDTWQKKRSDINLKRPVRGMSKRKPAATRSLSNCVPLLEKLASVACPCPCPSPGPCCPCDPCNACCGNMTDCNCGRMLPPPCNCPPKCIQYMQGYYYYPYGTWFCGPYHVSTGAIPCTGPVCPGNNCGVAAPNPNVFCGKCPYCPSSCCGVLGCTACVPNCGPRLGEFPSRVEYFPPIAERRPYSGPNSPIPLGACLVPAPPTEASPKEKPTPKTPKVSSIPSSSPVTPRWVDIHAPCQCAECQAIKAANFLSQPKLAKVCSDSPKLPWRGINTNLVQRAPAKQDLKKPTAVQERWNNCEMLKPKHLR